MTLNLSVHVRGEDNSDHLRSGKSWLFYPPVSEKNLIKINIIWVNTLECPLSNYISYESEVFVYKRITWAETPWGQNLKTQVWSLNHHWQLTDSNRLGISLIGVIPQLGYIMISHLEYKHCFLLIIFRYKTGGTRMMFIQF